LSRKKLTEAEQKKLKEIDNDSGFAKINQSYDDKGKKVKEIRLL